VAKTGGQVVHGFIVEGVQNVGRAKGITFVHHSVVSTSARELVTSNFLPNQTPLFVEDPARGYDYDLALSWNTIAVADRPFRCPVTGARLPAWQPVSGLRQDSVSQVRASQHKPKLRRVQ